MHLDKGERAVLVIGGTGLFAALILFGLLESRGAYENAGYSIGGALVGFLAATALLYKVYLGAGGPLVSASERRKSPFVFEEVVKVLDLRATEHERADSPHPASLTDYVRVTKEGTQDTLTFHYATTGPKLQVTSLTHPHATLKQLTAKEHHQDLHLKIEGELPINLSHLNRGETTVVINAVTYFDAFQRNDGDWLHTHIDKPTGRLAMIVLFPDDRPITAVKGLHQTGRDPFEDIEDYRPCIMEEGRIAYWSIYSPELGHVYQLEWEW
jgi:hypothetical protein